MKKGLTEFVFILDQSGSMYELTKDTIGGFNSMIDKQRKEPGDMLVSTVLFDSTQKVLHDRVPLEQVCPMTEEDYSPRGCTALLDAVGRGIRHICMVHQFIDEEEVPEKTVFVITTDGMENASREFDAETVRHMISVQTKRHGWEFVFLGANIDAVETAAQYGIGREYAAQYCCDAAGTAVTYETLSQMIGFVRSCGSIPYAWQDEIERDMKSRAKR